VTVFINELEIKSLSLKLNHTVIQNVVDVSKRRNRRKSDDTMSYLV